jgi:hypothetical protein
VGAEIRFEHEAATLFFDHVSITLNKAQMLQFRAFDVELHNTALTNIQFGYPSGSRGRFVAKDCSFHFRQQGPYVVVFMCW